MCRLRDKADPAAAAAAEEEDEEDGAQPDSLAPIPPVWCCYDQTCLTLQYEEAAKCFKCGAKNLDPPGQVAKAPTPPKVKSIDQLVSRLAAVDVDASMEPGEDGVIKYYPISAEAAKNDELRTATEANIVATKAMVPQDDGTAALVKSLEAKLAKIPKNPPREVQQSQDAATVQRHKTAVVAAFTLKQTQFEQKQSQVEAEIEEADVNLTKMEQGAELELQQKLAVFRQHHAVTIAKKKEEKEKGRVEFEATQAKQIAKMLDIDAALATAAPVRAATVQAPAAAASTGPTPTAPPLSHTPHASTSARL